MCSSSRWYLYDSRRHTLKLLDELLYHDTLLLSTLNISKWFINPRGKEDEHVEAIVGGSRPLNLIGPMCMTTSTFNKHS
jgi:hypothetical protein